MRRIYESRAIDRADDDPYRPNERDEKPKPAASRTLPSKTLSRYIVPQRLAHRAISVSVSTPQSTYDSETPVPVLIRLHNSAPFPVTIKTQSPKRWLWHVDGYPEASHVASDPPEEPARFEFDRGERKQFTRHWHQLFKTSDSEWTDCDSGTHIISAAINVEEPSKRGLYDQTEITVE